MSVRVVSDTQGAGLRALAKRLEGRKQVLVGVPAGKVEADGTSMALVAAANEFGVPEKSIPERPAFRRGIRNNQAMLAQVARVDLIQIAEGRMSEDSALARLGAFGAGAIQREMAEGSFAPNAPATVKRKGSDHPWIDSGAVRQQITYVVEPVTAEGG